MSGEAGSGEPGPSGAATERRTSRASLVVYAMSPVGIAAYWFLRSHDLIAQTPVWIMGILLLTASTANYLTTLLITRRPESVARMHARAAASALATALVVYA